MNIFREVCTSSIQNCHISHAANPTSVTSWPCVNASSLILVSELEKHLVLLLKLKNVLLFVYRSLSEAMTKEKIAAIKAKRLAKKKTTIRVDDELEPDLLVWHKKLFLFFYYYFIYWLFLLLFYICFTDKIFKFRTWWQTKWLPVYISKHLCNLVYHLVCPETT